MWMGYSVGRWEGDTLVVESNGFNDRTWLNNVGLPHTEKLRVTERYTASRPRPPDVDVTFTIPTPTTSRCTLRSSMRLVTDTEMLEEVCESKMEFWTGSISDLEKSAVKVPESVLSKYAGYYEGYWRANLRKVTMTLDGRRAARDGPAAPGSGAVDPESDTLFTSEEGVSYKFVMDARGAVTHVEEIHRGGNYVLNRKQ